MTRNGFKEAFRRGLGSAYIELNNITSREKFKDIVLWCCLNNTCYDSQSEGGRSVYLYNALTLYEDNSSFEEEIIEHFMKKKIKYYQFDQLCALLGQFAFHGSTKARNALYKKYDIYIKRLMRKGNVCSYEDELERICEELISFEGFRIFRAIIKQIGELNLRTQYRYSFNWFYTASVSKYGKKRVEDYFLKNANTKAVEAFFIEVEPLKRTASRIISEPTVDDLVKACTEQKGFHSRLLALRFAKRASDDDLIALASIAIAEADEDIKLGLLWVFIKRKFPLDEKYVISLTESDNDSIKDVAFEMLCLLSSERVHDYVIRLIKQKKEVANALSVLCHCYKREDEGLLVRGIKSIGISHRNGSWHGVFYELQNLIGKVDPSLFIYVYRKTLCSYCRRALVAKMSKRGILPRDILEECLYDSYDETRKLATRKLNR